MSAITTTRSRRTTVALSVVVGLIVLSLLVVVGWPFLKEEWYLHQLRSGDGATQTEASAILARMRSRKAVPVFISIVRASDDPESLHYCSRALAKIGAVAVSDVVALLAGRDPSERRFAARTLGEMGSEAAEGISALIETLDDFESGTYSSVSQAAARALERIGYEAIDPLVLALDYPRIEVRDQAALVLQEIGAPVVTSVVTALTHPSPAVRGRGARILAAVKVDRPDVVRGLVALLGDNATTMVTSKQKPTEALYELVVGDAAQRALVELGPAVVPQLIDTVRSSAGWTRFRTLGVLRSLRQKSPIRGARGRRSNERFGSRHSCPGGLDAGDAQRGPGDNRTPSDRGRRRRRHRR